MQANYLLIWQDSLPLSPLYHIMPCHSESPYNILHTRAYDKWLWKSQIWITPGETGGSEATQQ